MHAKPTPDAIDRAARAICRERCAFMGDPPCYDSQRFGNLLWPNPDCDDPGCHALAKAALS